MKFYLQRHGIAEAFIRWGCSAFCSDRGTFNKY